MTVLIFEGINARNSVNSVFKISVYKVWSKIYVVPLTGSLLTWWKVVQIEVVEIHQSWFCICCCCFSFEFISYVWTWNLAFVNTTTILDVMLQLLLLLSQLMQCHHYSGSMVKEISTLTLLFWKKVYIFRLVLNKFGGLEQWNDYNEPLANIKEDVEHKKKY